MSFKMVKHLKNLSWTVKVNVPVDGGETQEYEFTAKFKVLKQSEYDAVVKAAKTDEAFISQFLLGWEGLLDDDDKEVKFTKKALNEFCQYPFAKAAIIRAYREAAAGIAAKN